ncbi:TPA: hypothetical protein HA251_04055 [Candidatus Woesearchaeota archaeon]|nr:hypothetical protein [Candidatus Woesearchaeota archaeon]
MLDKALTQKITDFVRQRPRTVQEIAFLIERNWRTAESYIERISTETGLLATRTFREGTRGALKVVYWNALEPGKGSAYQERLLQRITLAARKEDFSPFDIYQFVQAEKREAFVERHESPRHPKINYDTLLPTAQHQVLLFSGNLSWLEQGHDRVKMLEGLAKRRVSIKILTRIDTISRKNVETALAINTRAGWDAIEIRHCEQPLRAALVDDSIVTIKEVLSPVKDRELKERKYLFYIIHDDEWVRWVQKVFWHLWAQSVDAPTRIGALATLKQANK